MTDGNLESKIDKVSQEVTEVKLHVSELNGKVDNLTNLMGSKWENVEERFKYMDRAVAQSIQTVTERINFEVQRSDEVHKDIRQDITDMKTKELEPIKAEVETSKSFRNRVIGIAIGVSMLSGGTAGVIAKNIADSAK